MCGSSIECTKASEFFLTGPAQTQSLFVCVCTCAAGVTGLEARDSVRRTVSEDVARLMLAAYPKANLGPVASVVFCAGRKVEPLRGRRHIVVVVQQRARAACPVEIKLQLRVARGAGSVANLRAVAAPGARCTPPDVKGIRRTAARGLVQVARARTALSYEVHAIPCTLKASNFV